MAMNIVCRDIEGIEVLLSGPPAVLDQAPSLLFEPFPFFFEPFPISQLITSRILYRLKKSGGCDK